MLFNHKYIYIYNFLIPVILFCSAVNVSEPAVSLKEQNDNGNFTQFQYLKDLGYKGL